MKKKSEKKKGNQVGGRRPLPPPPRLLRPSIFLREKTRSLFPGLARIDLTLLRLLVIKHPFRLRSFLTLWATPLMR